MAWYIIACPCDEICHCIQFVFSEYPVAWEPAYGIIPEQRRQFVKHKYFYIGTKPGRK